LQIACSMDCHLEVMVQSYLHNPDRETSLLVVWSPFLSLWQLVLEMRTSRQFRLSKVTMTKLWSTYFFRSKCPTFTQRRWWGENKCGSSNLWITMGKIYQNPCCNLLLLLLRTKSWILNREEQEGITKLSPVSWGLKQNQCS
jgi:hypothetical protein